MVEKENQKKELTFKERRKLFYRSVLKGVAWLLFVFPRRIKVEGMENLPKNEGYLLCPNHKSVLDAVFLVGICKQNVHFMSKEEVWKHWWGRAIAYVFDMIPVKRNAKDISAVKEGYKVLKEGEPLGIFPEGTRNGLLKGRKMKSGPIHFALKQNVPIVPVAFIGDFKVLGKGNIIRFGKPIYLKSATREDLKNAEYISAQTQRLQDEIILLSGEKQYLPYLSTNLQKPKENTEDLKQDSENTNNEQ